ncbi:MAG: hypothetical protein V4591_09055 [Bdellovibrionota bacterium]
MKLKLSICSLFILFSSCVVGFSNSQNHVSSVYSKIYVPSANDHSIYSGNSSRLSYAVRNVLSNRTDIELCRVEEARIALQITVIDRQQSILAVDNCANPGTSTVGNGAFLCSTIHPELRGGDSTLPTSFNQPSVSPTSESLSLVVDVKVIDLNDGNILLKKRYLAKNVAPAVFNEIGDTGDGILIASMSNKPDMHGLRYQEAVDNAVQAFSNAFASQLQNDLFANLPKN